MLQSEFHYCAEKQLGLLKQFQEVRINQIFRFLWNLLSIPFLLVYFFFKITLPSAEKELPSLLCFF